MRTLTIVDMKFHNGELFVSGISNEEFASTLRRIPYPFTGRASESKIRIYHIAHTRYETRAPIRAMQFGMVDGQDTLIAAYTCSPLVLIPVAELKDGAKVTGRTIGDMGNGQPLSMVTVKLYGQDTLFVTNAGHGPRMIPLAGLSHAVSYTPANSPKGYPSDLSPEYPMGPVGKSVMFIGASLHADRLNDKFLVSLTRDADFGQPQPGGAPHRASPDAAGHHLVRVRLQRGRPRGDAEGHGMKTSAGVRPPFVWRAAVCLGAVVAFGGCGALGRPRSRSPCPLAPEGPVTVRGLAPSAGSASCRVYVVGRFRAGPGPVRLCPGGVPFRPFFPFVPGQPYRVEVVTRGALGLS